MPSNSAAWQTDNKVVPLQVKEAPYTSPGAKELVVRNRALAINPVDWAMQQNGQDIFPFLKFPLILGEDVSGEVVEVGSDVTRFKPGDRIVGYALGFANQRTAEGAFQEHVVLQEHLVAHIPKSLSHDAASVIPLGLCTAASGLFPKDYLALPHPTLNPKPTGTTLLIWGGSTSVGSNAIQLARAAGCEVITTCSPRNFDYVKKLGATKAFDYNSPTVVDDVIAALKGQTCAGALTAANSFQNASNMMEAFAAGQDVVRSCVKVIEQVEGTKFIATANQGPADLKTDVGHKFIVSSSLKDNEVGPAVWVDYLGPALAEGKFVASPEPVVVGHGLEHVQTAFDAQEKGVSAKKIVLTL
ncbi:MAG: hypothetical protein M1828_002607 [Chrysothrix sp. TS-e1954]|nr:MAG: hypothetical protein M1828_002607 [Chrysothrix sp. TS-e1954]